MEEDGVDISSVCLDSWSLKQLEKRFEKTYEALRSLRSEDEKIFGSKKHISADEFVRLAYQRWTLEGITAEQLRDRRAPGMSPHRKLRKWMQLQAKGFIAGT